MFRKMTVAAVVSLLLSPAALRAGQKPAPAGGSRAAVVSAILRNATAVQTGHESKADYGTALNWADTLRTDGNGRVRLQMGRDSFVSVGTNSELVLIGRDQIGKNTLELSHGQMRLQPATTEVFEIRTPQAIITGTGSDFAVDATVPGRLRVICLEGTATIASPDSGATSECDAGEIVIVKSGKAPYQPQLADATTLGIARNITDPEQQEPTQYFP
jgi:ferric-dicitrate binding protein FerR (iron transport regulator)